MEQEKLSTGVKGLDDMLGGGITKGYTILVIGAPGTGKTTLSLQFIWEGLKNNENCIFISFEEDGESIVKTALSYNLDFMRYAREDKLLIIKVDPIDMKTSTARVRSELPILVKEFNASRVVIDSITHLNMIYSNEADRRIRLFSLCQEIKKAGATALLTTEAKEEYPFVSKDGFVEYIVDGVISLRTIEADDMTHAKQLIRIIKMRRTSHSRDIRRYNITENGMVVYSEYRE
ncbi:MAG: KaiC domain-containing protein [Candidatus Thermoplasmatota archaeon]